MENSKENIESLILGSTFLGTGGGGRPEEAVELLEKISSMSVLSRDELPTDGVVFTAFAVGSVTGSTPDERALHNAWDTFKRYVKSEVVGIVPVEIGPKSLATAFYLGNKLEVPVLDADIVGGRASPEVFLETITLFNIPRTPCVVANGIGDVALLESSSSYTFEEKFLRSFAENSGAQVMVIGYPMSVHVIKDCIEWGTVSEAIKIGKVLKASKSLEHEGFIKEFVGVVSSISKNDGASFLELTVTIESMTGDNALLFVKNENLILWINGEAKVTCPDLICVLDDSGLPLYSSEWKVGANVSLYSIQGRRLWRTQNGKKLFSPAQFGFECGVVESKGKRIQ